MIKGLDNLFNQAGFQDFKWIETREIKLAQWVRFKCLFGCPNYGKKGSCPPNIPSIEICREFIYEYENAVIFHIDKTFEKSEDRASWSKENSLKLIKLEQEIFSLGYYKVFLVGFDACRLCNDCTDDRARCAHKPLCRPGADAIGIDVYATARSAGYPIQVLKNENDTMNRYAFMLIE